MNKLVSELNSLMIKYRFKPRKQLSQNFLINEKLIQKIINLSDLNSKDKVLEIGCGSGFLTRELLKKSMVIGVEKDKELVELLEKEISSNKFNLIPGDFLKVKLPSFNKVVSLPPYHISSKILLKLMMIDFDFALLVFQKDFAEKLLSEPGFSEFTAITFLVNYFFEPKILIESISHQFFYPSPKTESSLIKLTKIKRFGEAKNNEKFIKFVKELFRFKNKNLSNALNQAIPFLKKTGLKKEKINSIPEQLLTEKVNLIEIKELVELFNSLT